MENRFCIKMLIGRKTGFTLIELLVVIAIIAVLAAILLPALASAKNRAQMVTDLNNNKQLLTAEIMYATDNAEFAPQSGWNGLGQLSWAGGSGFTAGPCPPPLFDNIYNQETYEYEGKGSTGKGQSTPALYARYLPIPGKTFLCPADLPTPLYYQRSQFITSYIQNGAINGYSQTSSGITSTYKLTAFQPYDILFWENDETAVGYGQWNDFANYPDQGISARHGKGATIGYIDGSTSRLNLMTFWQLAANQTTPVLNGNGTSWKNFPGGNGLPNAVWCSPVNHGHPNN